MRVIAVINQKGGVGKTTCVHNIGVGLANLGQKVLLADLDPQAHLTAALGIDPDGVEHSTYEMMKGGASWREAAVSAGSVTALPSNLRLSGAEMEFSSRPGWEFLLKTALDGLSGFDYVLMDCPPNLGLLTINALTAAGEVFIPFQSEFMAMQSLSTLLRTVKDVNKRLNPSLRVGGIIATRYNRQKRLNRDVAGKIREYFGDKLFTTRIRDNISLAEAPGFAQDIFSYRPRSIGAADYKALCQEIQNKET